MEIVNLIINHMMLYIRGIFCVCNPGVHSIRGGQEDTCRERVTANTRGRCYPRHVSKVTRGQADRRQPCDVSLRKRETVFSQG